MKTVIISGSIRKGRQSHKVAAYVAQTLKQSGAEVDLIDPAEYPLPLLGSESKENQANTELIGSRLNEAEALIFVTPEYHGSFSGVLKNVIDHYWAEFQNKPIGVAAVSAGKLGGINASTQLQHVVLSLGAYPVPVKLLISNVTGAFDESGNPIREDPKLYEQVYRCFYAFCETFSNRQKGGRGMNKEINLKAYFKRVGFTGSASPHLEVLKSLHLLHPQNIPFENLNPFTGQQVLLDTEPLQQKLIFGSRGGYCFEQNLLFMHVLKAVGFCVKGLAARIMWNAPEGTINSRGHMLLLVEIESRRYIADVGFGGLGPTAPILLEPGKEQETLHETYRIDAENKEYTLMAFVKDEWKPLYRFNLDEHFRADYEVTNWYLSNHPESHFVTDLIAARAESNPRRRYTLRNNEFTVHDFNSGTKKSRLNTVEEIRETLENVFGIRLPDGRKLNNRLKEVIEKENSK